MASDRDTQEGKILHKLQEPLIALSEPEVPICFLKYVPVVKEKSALYGVMPTALFMKWEINTSVPAN